MNKKLLAVLAFLSTLVSFSNPAAALSCQKGYIVSNNACVVNPCTGYNYTKCPTGYAQSAACQSGKTQKLKCGNCASGYVKYNGKCYKKLACKNGGSQAGDKCACKTGWTGNLCQTAQSCPYKETKCPSGYTATGKTCQTGNKKVVECKANACTGYNYTKCPTGYAQSASCLSGKTKKLKCETCANGYIKYNGKCIKKLACKNGGSQVGEKCSCKTGWTGNLCQTAKTCPYKDTACAAGYVATGKTCQTGNKKVVECKANPCTGYNYTKCPTGYAQTATCQSGKTKKLKCDNCASGYVKYNGKCYKKITCKNGGSQVGDRCSCPSGWTGTYCETANKCGYNTTQCPSGYVETGNTCKSGTTLYKECKINPCTGYVKSCPTGYYATGNACLSGSTKMYKCAVNACSGYVASCGDGYHATEDTCMSGNTKKYKCAADACSGYQASCGNGYHATEDTCMSGNVKKYKCAVNDCSAYQAKCGAGYDAEQKCLSGSTPYYTCTPKQVPEGYTTTPCGEGYNQAEFISGEDTYYKCTPKDCSAYQASCGEGYDAEQKCLSGDTPYYQCTPKQVPEGYTERPCGEGYDEVDSIVSGTKTYYKCTPKDCSAYQASCGAGYDAEQKCLSGSTTYYTCTPKQVPEGYTTTPCGEGYNQAEFMSGEDTYYKCTPKDCSAYQAKCGEGYDAEQKCLSGDTPYYQCTPKQVPAGYTERPCGEGYDEVDSIVSGTKTYYKCTPKDCSAYQAKCGAGYDAEQKCLSGSTPYYTCTPKQVPEGYTTTPCGEGYNQAEFMSGEDTYYKCTPKDCSAYQASCGEGYDAEQKCLSGDTPYYQCTPKQVPAGYTERPCGEGYTEVGTFLSGTTTYYKCKEKTVSMSVNNENISLNKNTQVDVEVAVGFEAEKNTVAVNAYADASNGNVNATIEITQSGTGAVYGMEEVSEQSGQDDETLAMYNSLADNSNRAEGTIRIVDDSGGGLLYSGTVIGMQGFGKVHIINAGLAENADSEAYSKGLIDITNNSDKTVSGIRSFYEATNADGAGIGQVEAEITINNTGDGNVYGILAADNAYNTEAKANDNLTARITIDNTGDGDVYGILSGGEETYNAFAGHERGNDDIRDNASANAQISIDNVGAGDIYGIRINNAYGTIYNAYAYYDSSATGTVRLNGNGDIFGLWGNTVYNGFAGGDDEGYPFANGNVKIINDGAGDAYGIYGVKTFVGYQGDLAATVGRTREELENMTYVVFDRIEEVEYAELKDGSVIIYDNVDKKIYNNSNSLIEMANIGNGLAVGIYGNNSTIENSGDIKIHNLGEGVAVGIYADGNTSVTNSGNIIIDRDYYYDEAKGRSYFAETDVGGKAIGIYGAIGSEIINDGVININGASTAYGIWSEGGNVTNSGRIIINGNINHENAIRLNGGQLFQDGTMIVEADWSNNGQSGESEIVIGSNNVVNNDIVSVDNDADKRVVGIFAEVGNYGIANALNASAEVNINNYGAGEVYGMLTETTIATNARSGRGDADYEETSGTINITNTGDGSVYGIKAALSAENAATNQYQFYGNGDEVLSDKETRGVITITDTGNGNVYGLYGSGAINAENDWTLNSNSLVDATIEIEKNGTGDVYGVYGGGNVQAFNYQQETYSDLGDSSTYLNSIETAGTVRIDKQGNGDVYGLYSPDNQVVNLNNAGSGSTATAILEITNENGGSVYGIYGNSSANAYLHLDYYNEYSEGGYENNTSTAQLTINNTGDGEVYGLHGVGEYSFGYNLRSEIWYDVNYNAEVMMYINNTGDGDVYGIKAYDAYNLYGGSNDNSDSSLNASISIYNTGNGDVYGLYGENAAANNILGYGSIARIIVESSGTGDVYGIRGGGSQDWSETKNGTDGAEIEITAENSANVYGIYGTKNAKNGASSGKSVEADGEDHTFWGQAEIRINATEAGNVYGIYAENNAYNSSSTTVTGYSGDVCSNTTEYAQGIIDITNSNKGESGNVYGMYALQKNDEPSTAIVFAFNDGEIRINNSGNSNVYGMYAAHSAANSGWGDQNGSIGISNFGSGDVYGIYAGDYAQNGGSINIDSHGDGNVYGIYTNVLNSNGKSGTIDIINHSIGNVYGIKANSFNGYNDQTGENIEIANIGDGLAVGMYINGNILSNANIKIHNLGDGKAVGIYAGSNTTLTSTGNITIDRSSYTDSQGNSYSKQGDIGGKAVGIYGESGSRIRNDGTIRINDASVAYGIYSEGGNVTNYGYIYIDGNANHENAIRLNGGQLFQNGTVIVEADWSNNGTPGTGDDDDDDDGDDEPVVINNQNRSVNENTDGDVVGFDINEERATGFNVLADEGNVNVEIEVVQGGSGGAFGMRQLPIGENVAPDEDEEDYDMINALATKGKTAVGTIRVTNTGEGDSVVAGIYSNAEYVDYISNASVDDDDANAQTLARGLIEVSSTGDKDVYGIYGTGEVVNAEGDLDATAEGTITIINNGNGDVFGIKAGDRGCNADSTESGIATAEISIDNHGDGNVYGIVAQGGENTASFNAMAGYLRTRNEEKDSALADALINIENSGEGNVFGMMVNNGEYGHLHNAYAYYDSEAGATVRVSNKGGGNAYGLWSSGEVRNAVIGAKEEGYSPQAHGLVRVINQSNGNAAGIVGRYIYNETDNTNQYSTVELVNRGSGLVAGLYSQDGSITNSGDIIIHNLGDGTAVGIYSDGYASITNSGNITIDRESYVDDMGTEDATDDRTYNWTYNSDANEGSAFGIYGAKGNIINQAGGVITISDISDAYGIYTESGTITNRGQIIINGNYDHRNAIVLNGGKLIQDGILQVKAGGGNEDVTITYNNSTIDKIGASAGAVVGMDFVDETGVNAYAHEQNETGIIKVTQNGSGSVYGMRATVTNPQYGDDDHDEDDDGFDLINSATDSTYISDGTIRVVNRGDGDGEVFGMYSETRDIHTANATYGEDDVNENTQARASIVINNTGNKNVYGISSGEEAVNAEGDEIGSSFGEINITNNGGGNVYGIKAYDAVYNTDATENSAADGRIYINNTGDGNVYGLYSVRSRLYNADSAHARDYDEPRDTATTDALINIDNVGNGEVYGMKGVSGDDFNKVAYNALAYYNSSATGRIRISNEGSGKAFGMYGTMLYNAEVGGRDEGYCPQSEGTINVINKDDGIAYGMYGRSVENQSGKGQYSTIEMANLGSGTAIGIYAKDGYVLNSGEIKIHNLGDGVAVGIMADGYASVSNLGHIMIDRSSYTDDMGTGDDITYSATGSGGSAYGIYGSADSTIVNDEEGVISIEGISDAYGIYSEGGEVYNYGQIVLNGVSVCDGNTCSLENAIVLNGGQLFQDGMIYVPDPQMHSMSVSATSAAAEDKTAATPTGKSASLNLDDFGGTVVASGTSQFIVEGSISGNLAINNNVVENGFDTTYTVANMIDAEDTTGLHLVSQSALFDAALQNGSDAVMTMKSFNDVVENQSVANFLKRNYAAANNEELFALLKNKETVAMLNDTVNSITAIDVFNRFNFEDLTMMRELNGDVNNMLFNNQEDYLVTAGEIAPFYFDNDSGSNGRYALYNHNMGRTSYGLSIGFSNINSSDRKDKNKRQDEAFQMSAPFGYNRGGFKFITAPRLGYAYGTYDRNGYEGRSYDGTMEKRIFGLTNEARYPIAWNGWSISPSAEFNVFGYHLKGHEEAQEYALKIKSQNNYSVEAGLGLYVDRAFKPTKNSKFNLRAGVAAYHEFMDPYSIELGMQNMTGSFNIRDDRRKDNRAVLRAGFDYSFGDITIEGSWASYIDGTTHNNANLDFKYNF